MKLSEVDSGRQNNMDIIRFAAASWVIYSHSFDLLKLKEPIEAVTGFQTGPPALAILISLSGFLIAKSLASRPSLVEFLVARTLRIFPALIAVNIVVVLAAGFFWTSLSTLEFFGSLKTWTYVFWNTSLLKCQYDLPGVFVSNPIYAVNGSLWTLPVEARMYGLVFLAGLCAFWINRFCSPNPQRSNILVGWFGLVGLLLSFGGWDLLGLPYSHVWLSAAGVNLMGYFSMGMLAHSLRDRIRLNGWVVSAGFVVLVILHNTVCYQPLFTIWIAYACLWIAYTPRINAHQFASKVKGDFSYGIYIYAYPVQQWLYSMDIEMHPLINTILTFFIVLPLAACSFWYIEKPPLGMKHTVALRIRSVFRLNKSTE
jgi:peptidoglycan/LPS O-acetylase OafA/YrhL